jgi:hypothetical protein
VATWADNGRGGEEGVVSAIPSHEEAERRRSVAVQSGTNRQGTALCGSIDFLCIATRPIPSH